MRNYFHVLSIIFFITTLAQSQSGFFQAVTKAYETGVHGKYVRIIHTLPSGDVFVNTEQGLFRSSDNGNTWKNISDSLPQKSKTSITSIAHIKDHSIWLSTLNGIYQSTDNGDTWNQIAFPNSYVESLAIDQMNNIYVKGTDLAWLVVSSDFGKTWTVPLDSSDYSVGIPGPIFIGPKNSIFVVGFNATIDLCGFSRSDEFGKNWTYVGIHHMCPSCLAFTPDNTIYVSTTRPAMHFSPKAGIYKSINMGEEWIRVTPESENIYHNSVSAMAINSFGHIYYSNRSDSVIHRTTDEGISFETVSENFKNLLISSLAFDKDDYLFVGTERGGLFRSTQQTTKVETRLNRIDSNDIFYIYPNPSNNHITLYFTVNNAEQVTAKIYNHIGQEIAIIDDNYYSVGSHQLIFRTTDIATGIYFVQLKIGSFISNHKFAIIK